MDTYWVADLPIEENGALKARISAYIVDCIRNPDEGSEFAKQTAPLRALPDEMLIPLMLQNSYGGMMFLESEEILGAIFFQQHGEELRVFRVLVEPKYRNRSYAQNFLQQFLIHTAAKKAATEVRLGAGGHPGIVRFWQRLVSGAITLPFEITAGSQVGSIVFAR